MSELLDLINEQAANGTERTVTLSPYSVAVLLSMLSEAENPLLWDKRVTASQWDEIERMIGNAYYELLSEVIVQQAVIGEVREFAFYPVPDNWLLCMGQDVSRATYASLFAVIGTTFGDGDGTNSFTLPDLRWRVVVGINATVEIGDTGGEAEHLLTVGELPSHVHQQTVNNTTPAVRYTAGGSVINQSTGATSSSTTPLTTQSAGGGEAHNNMQPYMQLVKAIYAGEV